MLSIFDEIPLEDEGGDGSKGGHLERFVFGVETMVAEDIYTAQFSKITLSLLKDSGWYVIDLSDGDYYTWGKGEGCDLFYRKCSNSSADEVCTYNNNFGCDKTFRNKMICHSTDFSDGCKIKTKGQDCLVPHYGKWDFEIDGPESRCQEFRWKGQKYAGCLKVKCAEDKKSYDVFLKDGKYELYYTCYGENDSAKLNSTTSFYCENPKVICGSLCPKNCNNRGKCLENGYCSCNPFYSGEICGNYHGCKPYGLKDSTCKMVLQSNKIQTYDLSDDYSPTDYDVNYLLHSSWKDLAHLKRRIPVTTDSGI